MEYRLVPTRVGMILGYAEYRLDIAACPHTRGDDPTVFGIVLTSATLVPTRVGMIAFRPLREECVYTCPHTRGDDPIS